VQFADIYISNHSL